MIPVANQLVKFLFIGLILLAACKSKNPTTPGGKGNKPSGPLQVQGFRVENSTVSDNIEVPGSLLPSEETQIRTEVGGRVVYLNIDEGAVVKKGTVLVRLFDEDLQAQLKKLQVQLEIAQKTAERQQRLLKIEAISQQEYDLSMLGVENLNADIQTTRIAISRTQIKAPYDGKLGLRNISLGSIISPTDVITTLRQVDILKLEFAIPEKYAPTMQKGYQVRFRVDVGRDDHKATVIATENSVEATTRTLRVKALVNEHHPELVPGSFATVNLQLGKNDQALLVPSQAIIPQARNKQVIVYKQDSARFVNVETGIRNSSFVQILRGVEAGDTIITTGLMAIRPNTKIRLTQVTSLKQPQTNARL